MPYELDLSCYRYAKRLASWEETSADAGSKRERYGTALARTLCATLFCVEMVLTGLSRHELARASDADSFRIRFICFHGWCSVLSLVSVARPGLVL